MLTLEQVLARAMKTSRGPSARHSSLKIDENLHKVSREKKTGRISFARPQSLSTGKEGVTTPIPLMNYPEPEPPIKPHGLAPNGVDLSLSLKSSKILGDWRAALSVFSFALFSNMSYKPNAEHLKQFMAILKKEDKLDVALHLLTDYDSRMKKAVEESSPSDSKDAKPADIAFDVQGTKELMYHILMRAHADSKNWEKALRVLNNMVERNYIFPKTETLNIVLSAMDDGEHWERALDVLNQMIRARNIQEGTVNPDDARVEETNLVSIYDNALPNTVTYATTITLLEAAGKFQLAQKLLREIPKKDRDAIMRSYAAVIHVWSMQHHRSGKKHGRIL